MLLPKPKKKKCTWKKVKREAKSPKQSADAKMFGVNSAYHPGMKYNNSWAVAKKAEFDAARCKFHQTGTKEAVKDKVEGLRVVLEKAKHNELKDKIEMFTSALARWEKKLANM